MESPKGMELYSWKDGRGSWSFSLLPGTNRNKVLAEIQKPSVVIHSVEQLGRHLSTLAAGEDVFWFLADFKDLSYPDRETISRIQALAEKHGVTLHIDNTLRD